MDNVTYCLGLLEFGFCRALQDQLVHLDPLVSRVLKEIVEELVMLVKMVHLGTRDHKESQAYKDLQDYQLVF